MIVVDKELIKSIAKANYFEVDDELLDKLVFEIKEIYKNFDVLKTKYDISNIEPTDYGCNHSFNNLIDDVPYIHDAELVIKNVNKKTNDNFVEIK